MCLYNFGDYIASEHIYVRSVVRLNQNKKIESFLNQIQLQLFYLENSQKLTPGFQITKITLLR